MTIEASGSAAGGGNRPSDAHSLDVRFLGERRAYWRLLVRGALLLMVTLGIYRFWLMTDVRRFLWSNTKIAGEALEYIGTPLELLIGFLVAVAILIPVYTGFFLAALDLGTIGRLSGLAAFAALGLLGQYAVYRARRYRLTRTIYRGLRFHQNGSAWRYAVCAVFWWTLTALTLGLAYPFQLASLERYKMRNTFYGDLAGRFEGSGFRLLLRGLPMWFLVIAPLAVTVGAFVDVIDWRALTDAFAQGPDNVMTRIETGNPQFADVILFGTLMTIASGVMAALLYPAFQAMILRWWSSGLRFGAIEITSRLRTRQVYGAYVRFLSYALLFSLAASIVAAAALFLAGSHPGSWGPGGEIAATGLGLVGYVIMALGYSTIYRATVLLSLWQLGMESLQLSGLEALNRVRATGKASSPLGEGLADALNVGGY